MPQPDGSLLVYEYAGEGLTPSRIMPKPTEDLGTVEFLGTRVVNTHPVLKTWGVGSPAKVPLDELVTERGKYNATRAHEAGRNVSDPRGLSGPIFARLHVPFRRSDAIPPARCDLQLLGLRNLPNKERLHLALIYKTLNWKLQYRHNNADFYDLFGPVERSRKGDVFVIGWNKTTVYDPPRTLEFFWNGRRLLRPRATALLAERRLAQEHLVGRGRDQIFQHAQVPGRRRP